MKQQKPKIEDLEAFLTDDTLSKADALKELRRNGIDTDSFLARVNKVVQQGYTTQLREAAERERSARATVPGFLTDLVIMPRERMLGIFARVAAGEFGNEYSQAALARCRNKDASELTDEELRSWLEDIGEVLGEPEK